MELVGAWQGMLTEGSRQLRVVFRFSIENDKLSALNYRIEEGADPLPVTITRNRSGIRLTIPAVAGVFEGKLTADGNTLSGTYTRLDTTALTLVRSKKDNEWTLPEASEAMKSIPADAHPEFEVTTIKPSRPEEKFAIRLYPGGVLVATSATAADLIRYGFNVHPQQIAGAPGWMDSERYDVTGKPDLDGMPSLPQSKAMVKKLLADRFGLVFHIEKKELSVYTMAVGNGGPKMTPSAQPDGLPSFRTAANGVIATNTTMVEFAQILQANFVDQPVVDRTGLGAAKYAFALKWAVDPSHNNDVDPLPDLFTAFQQQLGLRLQSTKAQADILVIDQIQKPSSN